MSALQSGAVFNHYRLDRQLGEGGMGVVYDAFDLNLNRQVALKMVHAHLADEQFLALFDSEARTLAQIRSPHIIAIYDIGTQDGSPFIVTQFIKGGDLTKLVRTRGPMVPHLACRVSAQVAEALHDAHLAGIIHQDVKPANVLVKDPTSPVDPVAYLCDFGIASTSASAIEAGSVTGTWTYLAPEYATGAASAPTPSRDVYAAGCMFWFMLTGAPPYRGTVAQIAMAHQQAPIPQFDGTDAWSKAANRVLQLSMAKDPRARYQTAAAFKDDLLKLREITAPSQIVPVASPMNPNPASIAVPVTRAPQDGESVTIEEEARPSKVTVPRVGAAVAGVVVLGVVAALGITRPWVDHGLKPIVPTVKGAAVADVNGDKLGDVVTNVDVQGGKGADVVVWRSNGRTLTPSKPTVVTGAGLPADGPAAEVFPLLGNFKGTGKNALVTFVRDSQGFTLSGALSGHIKPPAGVVAQGKKMTGSAFYYDLGAADFDGDGVTDLFMETYYGNPDAALDKHGRAVGAATVWVYRGTKTGFATPTLFATYAAATRERIAVGDFNGDHKADLAVLNRAAGAPQDITLTTGTSTLTVYAGNGKTAEAAKPFSFEHHGVDSFLAGDVNGDGRDELVVEESGRGEGRSITVGAWGKDLTGFSIATRGNLPAPGDLIENPTRYPATLSDVNGDGLTDVVALSRQSASSPYQFYVDLAQKKGAFLGHTMATWKQSPDEVHIYNLMGGTLE